MNDKEFLDRLYALMDEFGMTISTDMSGDLNLIHGHRLAGYWTLSIEEEYFNEL